MNSHIPRFRTLALAATVMASALSFQLHAGPKYYIFEIPPISTSSSADSRAFGLSNVDSNGNLLVVGQADASSGSRAFVWSWEAAFGLSAFTTYDLNTLAGETSALSKASKVNSYGQIAGQYRSSTSSPTEDRAHAWELDGSGGADMIALGSPFAQDAGQDSEATDVSESSSAWIVGWAHVDEEDEDLTIFCSGGTNIRAFRVRPDGTSMTELVAPENENRDESEGDNANAWGYGVNASGEAMGYVRPCENDSACFGEIDPASWSAPTTSIEMDPLELYDPPDGDHFAFGINDAGNGVGYGWSLPSPGGGPPTPVCGKHAGFWESDTATPVNLGVIGISTNQESIARAINNPQGSVLRVVGQNTTTNSAVLWNRTSGTWQNALVLFDYVPSATGWDGLVDATDVNDDGYIVGIGERDNDPRGYLLDPIETCWADFIGEQGGPPDCKVKGEDLAVLLGAWGTSGCGGAKPCYADLDQDGDVDGFDLALLNGVWTGANFCEECASSFMGGGSSGPITLEEAILALIAAGESEWVNFLTEVWPEE